MLCVNMINVRIQSAVMLGVIVLSVAYCHYDEFLNPDCRHSERRYFKCHILSTIMPSVIVLSAIRHSVSLLSVIILSVFMLNVAPLPRNTKCSATKCLMLIIIIKHVIMLSGILGKVS
jgi:hypothetical protein